MIEFETMRIREARDYAMKGGQALHMMTGTWARGYGGPVCFRRAKEFAHLFDQDTDRLTATARRLGVRVIVVSRRGTPSQHIDLCGRPLNLAKAETVNEPLFDAQERAKE